MNFLEHRVHQRLGLMAGNVFSLMPEARLIFEQNFSPNFAGLYQPVFRKKMRSRLRSQTILRQFVNTEYEGDLAHGGTQVTVFTAPNIKGTKTKRSTRNHYNKITRGSGTPTQETMTIDELYEFNTPLSIIDQRTSQIDGIAKSYANEISKDFEEVVEADIASNFVYVHNHGILVDEATGKITVNETAHAAGATVTVDDATNVAVGDIIFGTSAAGVEFAVLVKSKAGDVVTCESDESLFPLGIDGLQHFAKLSPVFPALADNAVMHLDHPLSVDKSSFYDLLIDLQTRVMENKVTAGDQITFSPLRPQRLLNKDDSPILKNDILGKNMIVMGTLRQIDNGLLYGSAHGTARVKADGTTVYYVIMFKNKWSINFVDYLQSSAVDLVEETGGTLFAHSGVNIFQSHAFEQGRKGIAVAVVKL